MCGTSFALSNFVILDDARANLLDREGMDHINGIGFVDLERDVASERAIERHPTAVQIIREWAAEHGFGAVIWTALAPNFRDTQPSEFSVEAAMGYLKALESEKLMLAQEYIRKAPEAIKTPLRDAFMHWSEQTTQ
ncbi:hypothetical protein [Rhizobium laguerreae]|nr:hypothetical protein [Rhizobium laguerreae]MBY3049751.1 hypothetical protein [Rhizobium laguerreae]